MNHKLINKLIFLSRNRLFILTFLLALLIQIYIYTRLPKQAWVEGLLEAWYAHNGLIFYKDFTTTYLPFLHLVMVPFHEVFGFTQLPTIILSPITSILVLILLAVYSYKFLEGWIRLIPIIFFTFWDPVLNENHFSTASFQGLINTALFLTWLVWFKRPKKTYIFLLGLLSSVDFFSLQMVFPFLGCIFLSIIYRIFNKEIKFESILFYFVGFLVPTALTLGYFIYNSALWDLYYWNVLYYIRDYPYAESFGRGFINSLIFFAIFAPLITFLVIIKNLFKRVKNFNFRHFSMSQYLFIYLSLLGLVLTFWFAIFHPVRFQIGMPISSMILGLYLQEFWKGKKLLLSNLLIICLILLLNLWVGIEYIVPKYKSSLNHPQKNAILTAVYKEDPMFDVIAWIKENTNKNDKIIALADPLFYLEVDRLPAHRKATKNLPFLWLPLEGLDKELTSSPISFWIIDERLIEDRFIEYGYPEVSTFFNKIYRCEPIVFRKEYFTVRKNTKECI